ncbi:MAG: esterase-like activity of phytase family protein [Ferruginibacter sp.]|nr:esterase-like activity of phytase family protein [Ferruginibacter sp.]
MKNFSSHFILIIASSVLLLSCSTSKKALQSAVTISSIKFLNAYEIPYNLQYKNTTVGGLSGIDYDAGENVYYFICDDRSDIDAARFYTARIVLNDYKIDSLVFTGVHNLLQSNGQAYPNKKQNKLQVTDPEAMRYNPKTKTLVWSSEGERIVMPGDTVLINPSVTNMETNGKFIDSFLLPANMHMQAAEKGPRRNGVFEGLAYAENYKTLYVSVEEPLYEDGPRAAVVDNNAFIRINKFNTATKKAVAQYAYKLDPVAYEAKPSNAFKVNGISDIMSLGNNNLLVIERSYSTGRLPCTIKVFIANLNAATDVTGITLTNNKNFIPAKKTLLLNMDSLDIYTDNIEGVTFGPVLHNGNKSLLFIADNNFNPLEKTQLLLFEIIE